MNQPQKDVGALFQNLFAKGFAQRGADHADELWLTEREAREGCTKRVVISRRVPCFECVELGARCGRCHDGLRDREETLDLVVRPGTVAGTRISVLGKGDAAPGRPSGDRYFAVGIERAGHHAGHPYRTGTSPTQPSVRTISSVGGSPAMVFAAMFAIATAIVLTMVYAVR